MTDLAKPGTKEAQEQGCTCPVIDNHYGKGYGGDGWKYGWYYNIDCPYHKELFPVPLKGA